MEEKLKKEAILRHIVGGKKPKAIYTEINRSKKWFFKWLKRYKTGDEDWYKERSRAPLTRPNETSKKEKELVISIRKRLESEHFAQIGVSAIKWELHKLGMNFSSDRAISGFIKQEGLVKKTAYIPKGVEYPYFIKTCR